MVHLLGVYHMPDTELGIGIQWYVKDTVSALQVFAVYLLDSSICMRYFGKHNKHRQLVCLEEEEFIFIINLNA